MKERTVMRLRQYPMEIQQAVKEISNAMDHYYGPDFFLWSQGSPEKLTSLPKDMSVKMFWCEVLSHLRYDLFYKYYDKGTKEHVVNGEKFML